MVRLKDFVVIFLLSVFSAFVTSYGFLKGHSLYWDSGLFFSLFRDNLHSLNEFGEVAWWFPHRQFGWPAYYYSILGQLAFGSPVQVVFGLVSYVLGQLGIAIASYHAWFVLAICFVSPMIVNSAVFLFGRQIFQDRKVAYFALILAAFSPSVAFNLSDPGFLEPTAYGLFFATAFLAYLRQPTRKGFYIFGLTCCLLGVNLNFPFIFWNVIAIPVFLILAIFVVKGGKKRFVSAWHGTALQDLILVGAAILLCSLPSFIVLSQVGHLIRYRMGQKVYDFTALYAGNPLELISVGWPGFGFDLDGERWKLFLPGSHHLGPTYLGLMCLPLTIVGLLKGARRLRYAFFLALTLAFGVFCLSAYSPLFATLLVWDTPLRTNNHYGDAFFRSGSYLILILTAALGFDAILRGRLVARKLLVKLYTAVTVVSAVVMISLYDSAIKSEPNFGFFTAMALVFFVLAYWFSEIKSRKVRERLIWVLMGCTLLDVSTVVNLNVRKIMERPYVRVIDETPSPDKLGMLNGDPAEYSQTILMYQEYYDLLAANIDANKWPMFRIFSAAHASQGFTADQKSFEDQNAQGDSLPMDAGALETEPFRKFAHDPDPNQSRGGLRGQLVHLSFNVTDRIDRSQAFAWNGSTRSH